MVLPDLMESEDNLNDYVKLKNIEGKVSIKKTCKHENFEEDKGESINENPIPIENNIEDEKLEFDNLDVSTEQELHAENDDQCKTKTNEIYKETENKKKGILKYQRTYSNKHVDFNMNLEFVPFDESKDYTIDIQIVEQMPKKIVSYAALFAQQKKEEEEKLVQEAEEKEKQNRKHNKKRKYEWKKHRKQEKQNNTLIQENKQYRSHLVAIDSVENHLSTEDEMEDEKEDFSENSYHSDTDIEEHSVNILSVENEGVMCAEDETFTNKSEESKSECKTPTDDLNLPLNNTDSGAEVKEACYNEHKDSKCQNSHVDESCGNTMVSENNADNLQLFCVPAKKQRSNSLSDLDDFRKPHRFVVQRLPREMELIICRQLEKQYYQ